jgi:hypothetical protein
MPKNSQLEISKLSLDLKNYRTTPQKNEVNAAKAMIAIKPEKFFALMDSILEDGYLQTENIIILETSKGFIVKEGNRRIATLKIIHGILKIGELGIPASILNKIKTIDASWLKTNSKVSCIIFSEKESDQADKIVTLTHAKGEKAGRDKWTSVATARHNRDVNKKPEPVLDLLEKYLVSGQNLTAQQKERWAGEYNLTVLVEAVSKLLPRLNFNSAIELTSKYPKIKFRNEFEELLRDIGLEIIGFPKIRNTQEDFGLTYGIPSLPIPTQVTPSTSTTKQGTNTTTPANPSSNPSGSQQPTNNPNANQPQTTSTQQTAPLPPKAVASNDPKHVANLLKKFNPRGKNREKVVALRNELQKLKINDNPIAFCFLLRSMFEISAKAYCADHGISRIDNKGKDKSLVQILSAINTHLTVGNTNTAMTKILHGAMTEIGNPDRLLSVTSMNQLVHNPLFSFIPNDICTLFGNIYPLLEAMN